MKRILLALAAVSLAIPSGAQSPRMVLFEEFTGENCPPCATANPALNALLDQPINQGRVAAIKWEVPIPSAPSATWSLYRTNKTEIDWRFRGWNGSTSSQLINPPTNNGYGYPSANTSADNLTSGVNSAPQGRLDGKFQWSFGATSNHVSSLTNAAIANAANVPSPFTINMTREWNNDATSITVNVTVTASQNYTSTGPLVFRTVMVERKIEFATAPGTNGEKTFKDVGIKSFPNLQQGTPLATSWTSGQTYTFSLACPIPAYVRKKTEIGFVGFIQDDGNREVQQAFRLNKEGFPYDASALIPEVQPVCSGQVNATIKVENKGLNPITIMTITPYTDGVAGANTIWTGNLAPDGSVEIPLDPFSVSLGSGPHTFSYTIVGMDGADIEVSNNSNSTTFLVASEFSGDPIVESFAGTFPPAKWTLIDPDNQNGWKKSSNAGGYGLSQESMMLSWYTNGKIGDVEEVILPPVSLLGNAEPKMDFLYAYAKKTNGSGDQLEILVSSDCGTNWTSVFQRSGDILKSVQDPVVTSFVPTADQWRQESISLSDFNAPEVIVKFRATSGGGNNLYIDDINIRQELPTGIAENNAFDAGFSVFPNPAANEVSVNFISDKAGAVRIETRNALGQLLHTQHIQAEAGDNQTRLDLRSYADGLYYVTVKTGNYSSTKKLTITH